MILVILDRCWNLNTLYVHIQNSKREKWIVLISTIRFDFPKNRNFSFPLFFFLILYYSGLPFIFFILHVHDVKKAAIALPVPFTTISATTTNYNIIIHAIVLK